MKTSPVFTRRVTNLFYLYFLWGLIQWLMMLVAVALNYAAIGKAIPGLGPESLSQYFIFCLFGAFYSSTMMRCSEWHCSNVLAWAALVVLAGIHMMSGLSHSLFLCIIAILFCIAVWRSLNNVFSMSWLKWIGKNTLQIYVLHRIFIEFFGMSAILFAVSHNLFVSKGFYYYGPWASRLRWWPFVPAVR